MLPANTHTTALLPRPKRKREKPDPLNSPLALDQIEEPPSVETFPQPFKKGVKKIILSAEPSPEHNVASAQHSAGETTDDELGSQSAPTATATADKVQTGASSKNKTLTFGSAPRKEIKEQQHKPKPAKKETQPNATGKRDPPAKKTWNLQNQSRNAAGNPK